MPLCRSRLKKKERRFCSVPACILLHVLASGPGRTPTNLYLGHLLLSFNMLRSLKLNSPCNLPQRGSMTCTETPRHAGRGSRRSIPSFLPKYTYLAHPDRNTLNSQPAKPKALCGCRSRANSAAARKPKQRAGSIVNHENQCSQSSYSQKNLNSIMQ